MYTVKVAKRDGRGTVHCHTGTVYKFTATLLHYVHSQGHIHAVTMYTHCHTATL